MGANRDTKALGSILLIIGWVILMLVIGVLYHYTIYSAPQTIVKDKSGQVKLILNRHKDGHFRLQAKINGKKITFLIDTGATTTALSKRFAKTINIADGSPLKVVTANGSVDAFLARAEIDIGPLIFPNSSVVVLPEIRYNTGLLGMNILKEFILKQSGNTLELIYHPTR